MLRRPTPLTRHLSGGRSSSSCAIVQTADRRLPAAKRTTVHRLLPRPAGASAHAILTELVFQMAMTALLVEIVLVGMLGVFTLTPLASWVIRLPIPQALDAISACPLHLQFAGAYVFGVIWNRVCDQLFQPIGRRLALSPFPSHDAFQYARIRVVMHSAQIRDHISYLRSLIRIARAATIALLGAAFTAATQPETFLRDVVVLAHGLALVVSLTFVATLSYFAWRRLERGYHEAIHDAWSVVSGEQK